MQLWTKLKKKYKGKNKEVTKEEPKEETKEIKEIKKAIIVENPPPEIEPVGVNQRVKNIEEKLDLMIDANKPKKKKSQFKMPYSVKSQLKKLAMLNKVLVVNLGTNRSITPQVATIKDGLIFHNGKYHSCSTDFVYLWNGKYPCIVLPEWDLNPIGTKDYYKAIDNGRKSDAEGVMIRALEANENAAPNKIPKKNVIFMIVGGIIVAYAIFGNG